MRFVLLLILFFASQSWAAVPSNECMSCHGEFKKTASHPGNSCTDCHTGIKEFPHKENQRKPTCSKCHNDENLHFKNSVHRVKGLQCTDCHNVHSGSISVDCISCHADATHEKLPSRAKHLAALSCFACHGVPEKSGITATLTLPKGQSLKKSDIDQDKNGIVDQTEWHVLEDLLERDFPGATINKQYWTQGNIHSITPKAADCSECHEKRTRFSTATAKITDETSSSFSLDPKIFVPEFPSLSAFEKTVHGKKGVTCTDCHISQQKVSDQVCARCHEDVYTTYKNSLHGKHNNAACTDCHNPHLIKPYKEYDAKERMAVCSRCHKDYIEKHKWLPNTALHFNSLECTTCHSPGSEKSMVFHFTKKSGNKKTALTYNDFEQAFGNDIKAQSVINKYTESILKGKDIGALLGDLNKGLQNDVAIGSEIIVTKVHHDYSVTRLEEKECITCHSPKACFYNSMYLNLPGKEEHVYVPVKGTILSTYPLGMALDVYVLGEQKITRDDLRTLVHKAPKDWTGYIQGLGFKLIDAFGIILVILVILGCMVHATLRFLVRKR
jgi:hypothetical protein